MPYVADPKSPAQFDEQFMVPFERDLEIFVELLLYLSAAPMDPASAPTFILPVTAPIDTELTI